MNITRIVQFFFFNDTATTDIYTLSLHDALPISFSILDVTHDEASVLYDRPAEGIPALRTRVPLSQLVNKDMLAEYKSGQDRKSTRLNSSHANISYAVFCLKKKNNLS